jgi:hypothetical protein
MMLALDPSSTVASLVNLDHSSAVLAAQFVLSGKNIRVVVARLVLLVLGRRGYYTNRGAEDNRQIIQLQSRPSHARVSHLYSAASSY